MYKEKDAPAMESTPITNFIDVFKWLSINTAKAMFLTSDISKQLTEHFGRYSHSVKIHSRIVKWWVIKHNKILYNVITSKRGAAIEIWNYSVEEATEEGIIEFIDLLYTTLR